MYKRVLLYPFIAWRNIELYCRLIFLVRYLSSHASILEYLPCQISEFPCKYLGVSLSPHKLTKAQAQPIIERIADRLPSWKADLLTKADRSVLVQYVLTSMLIYLVLVLDLPTGTLQTIDKIRRGFLWRGRKGVVIV